MDVTFLQAPVPLQKKFDAAGKHSYPFVSNFTSHTLPISNLHDLHYLMEKQAYLGHCLLKGNVTRELKNESRAGSTDRDALTQLICFDLDGMTGIDSADHFLDLMGLSDYSYILQWSSSSFLKLNDQIDTTFNAHIFMMVDTPVCPHKLKWWLKAKNIELFADNLQLTASDMALRWGLDITTCQNDKLLYIAPPDVSPPYEDTLSSDTESTRISYHSAGEAFIPESRLALDELVPDEVRAAEIAEINRLRLAKGLDKKRAPAYALKGTNVEYLPNPNAATITDLKEDRGFIYFNLNGGDSWAYYHPADNYEYIYNFKGEPTYRTEELLPAYYREKARLEGIEKAGGRIPIGFRGLQDGALYNGFYDEKTDVLELYMARRTQDVLVFLAEYNIEVDTLPTYRMMHDPHFLGPRIDRENKSINLYVWSELEKNAQHNSSQTPIIDRILAHVIGPANVGHFINWLAFVIQYKTASGTSWLLQGAQGTGKGILYYYILRPLIGYQNAVQVRTANFEDNYNGFLENATLVNVDEVDVPKSRREHTIMADLKNYMTEKMISIRKMYANVYTVPNRLNFIFSSNQRNPVHVEMTDRRFNIGDYQPQQLHISEHDLEQIEEELEAFIFHLLMIPVDMRRAQTAMMTEAKRSMQALSETSVDEIANALINGQADVLHNYCEDEEGILDIDVRMLTKQYNTLIREVICEGRDRFTRADLYTLFKATVGKVPDTPAKFTKYLKHHGIEVGLNRIDGVSQRGSLVVEWKNDEDWFARARREYGVMKALPEETPHGDKEKSSTRTTH